MSSVGMPPGRKHLRRVDRAVDDRRLDADRARRRRRGRSRRRSPRSARTWSAVVGLTRPKRLADGAASPPPKRSSSSSVSGWAGTRRPTVVRPPVTTSSTRRPRGTSRVSGPGQQASASTAAAGGTVAAQSSSCSAAAEVDDQRVVGRAALDVEDAAARGRVARRRPPSPYTVSVGMATSPPARSTSSAPVDVAHAGTASRNSSAASMKPNDSGVAKWSTLRKVRRRGVREGVGQRFARAGEVVVADRRPASGTDDRGEHLRRDGRARPLHHGGRAATSRCRAGWRTARTSATGCRRGRRGPRGRRRSVASGRRRCRTRLADAGQHEPAEPLAARASPGAAG